MKFTKTSFTKEVNPSSSFIIYITTSWEQAATIHEMARTMQAMHDEKDWYFQISTSEVKRDCRVPEFFHERAYCCTIIEHNNGDWDKAPTYELYIVE